MQSTVETAPNEAIHLCWKQSLINSVYLLFQFLFYFHSVFRHGNRHFLKWDVANPRTTTPVFSCIRTFLRTSVSTGFNPLYGFRNLNYCRFRQMEQLLLARTKKEFFYIGFLAVSSNFLLSDFRGLFVHARCTPHQ